MKLYELLKSSESHSVKDSRLLELKRYYLSMYRFYMLKLYDMAYISDPTVFSETELLCSVVDLGIRGLTSISGKIEFSNERVNYALCRAISEGAEEKIQFLKVLERISYYKEASRSVDVLYEMRGGSSSINLKLYCAGAKVLSKTAIPLNKNSISAFIPKGKTLDVISIRDIIWLEAMKELDIPEDDWFSDGLFDKNLSHEQELQNYKLLLNGECLLTGKYADNLENWLYEYKWSNSSMTSNKRGLVDFIYIDSSHLDSLTTRIEEIINSEPNVLMVYEDNVYCVRDIVNYKIPVSFFSVVCSDRDDLMIEGNALTGYSGEGYVKEWLEEEGISYVGLPILLKNSNGESVFCYDREQVSIHTDSWFSVDKIDFEFSEADLINTYRGTNTLISRLIDIYIKSQGGELLSIPLSEYSIKEIESAKEDANKYIVKIFG